MGPGTGAVRRSAHGFRGAVRPAAQRRAGGRLRLRPGAGPGRGWTPFGGEGAAAIWWGGGYWPGGEGEEAAAAWASLAGWWVLAGGGAWGAPRAWWGRGGGGGVRGRGGGVLAAWQAEVREEI